MKNAILLLTITLSLLLGSCATEDTSTYFDYQENLVAFFPFNGNTEDYSKFSNHAEAIGVTATKDRFGTTDRAFYFDGMDDVIIIPEAEQLVFTNEFTINLWVKATSVKSQSIVFTTPTETTASYSLAMSLTSEYDTNDIIFSTTPDIEKEELRKLSYEKDTWYMITCVLENDVMYLYIDGEPAVLKYIANEMTTPSIPLLIGNALGTSDKAFQGVIDDIRIYNKAKSADFVAGLYTIDD